MARLALTTGHPHPPTQAVPVSDESLALSLRDGDVGAGEELATRHYLPLMRYLHRLVGNEHLAEEIFQATWLSVLDHLDKFNPDTRQNGSSGGFKAWLYRIATNKANDHWRSRGRERAAYDGLKLVNEEEAPAAGHRMECSEEEVKLRRLIEQLPENQRQVLLLRYYSELKFIDIARMLGCPLNTALGRMHKAMLKLKQMMDGEELPTK